MRELGMEEVMRFNHMFTVYLTIETCSRKRFQCVFVSKITKGLYTWGFPVL